MLREPFAPFALGGHAAPDGSDRQQDAQTRERRKEPSLLPQPSSIATLQCIEKIAIPVIEPVLHGDLGKREPDQPDRQRPTYSGMFSLPESGRACPEPRKQRMRLRYVVLR